MSDPDVVRTVRFVLPEKFCEVMHNRSKLWAEQIDRTHTKAIKEAYIQREIKRLIEEEDYEHDY